VYDSRACRAWSRTRLLGHLPFGTRVNCPIRGASCVLFDPALSTGSHLRVSRPRTCARSSPRPAELGLTGELLLWAREQDIADDEPLFFSRKRGAAGTRRPLQRGQAWLIVKEASARADVQVLALRASKHGLVGEPAPVHPHLFRHARVRQIVRQTKSLPLAQRQAGWSRLQPAYLSIGDDEARSLMLSVTD